MMKRNENGMHARGLVASKRLAVVGVAGAVAVAFTLAAGVASAQQKEITESKTDDEIRVVTKRLAEGTAHPMAIKRILAGEVVAALHGLDAAAAARADAALDRTEMAGGVAGAEIAKKCSRAPGLDPGQVTGREAGLASQRSPAWRFPVAEGRVTSRRSACATSARLRAGPFSFTSCFGKRPVTPGARFRLRSATARPASID